MAESNSNLEVAKPNGNGLTNKLVMVIIGLVALLSGGGVTAAYQNGKVAPDAGYGEDKALIKQHIERDFPEIKNDIKEIRKEQNEQKILLERIDSKLPD